MPPWGWGDAEILQGEEDRIRKEPADHAGPYGGGVQTRWVAEMGDLRQLLFALSVLTLALSRSLSLTPTPSPLLQDDISTARQGLMGPLANWKTGGARCCKGG